MAALLASALAAQLVVFAASSLRDAFEELGRQFEAAHSSVDVVFNFAGSHELRTQIEHGAGADVFASADEAQLRALERAGLVGPPRVFARNEPVIAVPAGNPQRIRGLQDLPRAERIVLGVPEVPIGAYASRILDSAARLYGADFRRSVEARVVSRELNVRQVLAKVRLGEAGAAIVYRTDALAARDSVEAISIPREVNVLAEYPIATLRGAHDAGLALAFVEFVCSPAARAVLSRFGFQ
jgi:molybdate transport system substrate-binding protein